MSEFCFVCNGKDGIKVKQLSVLRSKYTNQSITEIIVGILGGCVLSRKIDDDWNSICSFCLEQIEDFTFHLLSADVRRQQLQRCLLQTEQLLNADHDNEVSEITDPLDFSLKGQKANEDWFDLTARPDSPDWPDSSSTLDGVTASKPKMKRKYSKRVTQFDCDICGSNFNERKMFKADQKWHKSHRGFTCRVCLYRLTSRETLMEHIALHENRPKSDCVVCDKSFPHNNNLKQHMKVHAEKDELCHLCGKTFVFYQSLKQHISNFHEKSWSGTCDICGITCKSRGNLVTHMSTHIDVRPYKCSHCHMKFKRRSHWRVHERRHKGDTKTVKCMICNAGFEHKFYLMRHMTRLHGAEQFLCPLNDFLYLSTQKKNSPFIYY